jgi:DNA-binding SARP family transcriptional activator
MSDLPDRAKAFQDDTVSFEAEPIHDALGDPLQRGQSLLTQSIQQLEALRQDIRRVHALFDEMWQQLVQREVQLDRRLGEAMSLLARFHQDQQGDLQGQVAPESVFALRVQTLGGFAVHSSGRELALGSSQNGRAVLRYLITRPERRVARDVLLDMFWTGEPSDRATHKLHIAVSKLRQTLAQQLRATWLAQKSQNLADDVSPVVQDALERCIYFEDDQYRLHPAIWVQSDADLFAAHFHAGERLERAQHTSEAIQEYRAALGLYGGNYLPEDMYADWAVAPRARMEEMYLTLLGRLADDYLERGQYTESIACCRQILAHDSFREDAYRQLMRCYSRMGRRNQALKEFAACKQVLQRELGVHPMRETLELRNHIAREEKV